MGWTTEKVNGRFVYKLNGVVIENPGGYGMKSRKAFLFREEQAALRRPEIAILDDPAAGMEIAKTQVARPAEREKVNAWGMPIYNDQPINTIDFYLKRIDAFIEYLKSYTNLKRHEAEWLRIRLIALFNLVSNNRHESKAKIRELAAKTLDITEKDGRYAKFLDLLKDVAATPGWFEVSRGDLGGFVGAIRVNRAAWNLWKHPNFTKLRRGFRCYTPKRAHRKKEI